MCYPILALVTIASATGLTSAPARPHTVLWPKPSYAYSIVVPPGWRTQEITESAAFMVYPPDKSCAIVVSWVEFPGVPGRTTDSVAEKAAAGARSSTSRPPAQAPSLELKARPIRAGCKGTTARGQSSRLTSSSARLYGRSR